MLSVLELTLKLTLNINKTKLMIFGTKHTLRNFKNISLAYDTDIVERVDNFKYLGVVKCYAF